MKIVNLENGIAVTQRNNLSNIRARLNQASQRLAGVMNWWWQHWLRQLRRNLRNDVWHKVAPNPEFAERDESMRNRNVRQARVFWTPEERCGSSTFSMSKKKLQ